MDRDKVVKGMEQFRSDIKPFCGGKADWERFDAGLALLKEQEALVRCRNCKRGLLEEEKGFHPHVWCRGQCHPDYWFCADGERKEDSIS